MSKGRVLMAMSGGLDSSVAAMMLIREGYELVGITMKTWEFADSSASGKETGCCSLDSIHDARHLAVSLGFPHYVLDIREEFNRYIVDDFVNQYLKGRTPNPCVLCNTFIKWEALLKRADQLGCDYIATGHYARIREENGRKVLYKGADAAKDQSYVLWGLSQEFLRRTIFPLGDYTKPQIREMAREAGFEEIAGKRESYEICFIPDNDYRGFLKRRVPDLEEQTKDGTFVDKEGNVLGRHQGFPFYTIGQRKGLNVAVGEPLYVTRIIPETNTVVLGKKPDTFAREFSVSQFNLIKFSSLPSQMEATVKIRYKDPGHPATIYSDKENGLVLVKMHEDVSAVTPGQSAVIYDGTDVIGGGFIEKP
ncbi:MAG: tRNA 2-thiouridine(34) synthase MnmA [Bacteroidales bacterium]